MAENPTALGCWCLPVAKYDQRLAWVREIAPHVYPPFRESFRGITIGVGTARKEGGYSSISTLFVLFCFFRASPTAYGGSQARGQIGAVAAGLIPQPYQCGIQAASATHTTAHSNTRSLTDQARTGIKPNPHGY